MTKYVGIKPYTYWRYPFKTIWEWITETPGMIGQFCQRGWRGYASYDSWNIDSYLAKWMPAAIRQRRDNGQGTSADMDAWIEAVDMWPNDEYDVTLDQQEMVWAAILTAIADGFEAAHLIRQQPWIYEGPTPTFNISKDGFLEDDPFMMWLDENREKHDAIEAELRDIQQLGLALFVEFYDSLWD